MDLSYSQENEDFRARLQEFLKANWPLPESLGDLEERKEEFRRRATEAGYMMRSIPKEYGGSEQPLDFLKGEIIREEIKKHGAPTEVVHIGTGRVVPVLLAYGTPEQKAKWIPGTVSREFMWCQGYSEPNAGSDLASLKTRAELVGDKWIINGQKIWSSRAHKDPYMVLLVRTEPEDVAPRHAGISYMLVDLRQPGVEIRPIKQISGEPEFNEVFFTNAEAPADAIVGGRGNGWNVSRMLLRYERAAFSGINWADSLIQRAVRTARATMRNGRPAIEDPNLRADLARLQARAMAMRYSAYRDMSMEAVGEPSGDYMLMQKLYLTEFLLKLDDITRDLLADDLMMLKPGEGKDGLKGNAKWVDASLQSLKIRIAGGSSNIQRNIIGERVLGLPRDQVGVNARKTRESAQ
jgi:alkylation response protein AidB-like acyl-CoA dehydrogenase